MLDGAKNFLTNTDNYLDNWRNLGHDTCYKITNYDVQPRLNDLVNLELETPFAKDCWNKGGLVKTCIR